jgi:uncharacterized protein (DUF1015 family)
MSQFRPFAAWRPLPSLAAQVASRPYDVLSSEEARVEAEGNSYSFLRVVKPEIALPPETDPHAPEVYAAGREQFRAMVRAGWFVQDDAPRFYVYALRMGEREQFGLAGLCAVADYQSGIIRRHELTRPDKEEDRRQHVRVSQMQAEPVFFSYRALPELDARVAEVAAGQPLYDFVAPDGVRHRLWPVQEAAQNEAIEQLFATQVPAIYVADGHHRTAAAAGVGEEFLAAHPDAPADAPQRFFLSVLFPDNQLQIFDYNRVLRDLGSHSPESFLAALAERFTIEASEGEARPQRPGEFGLYLAGRWHRLSGPAPQADPADPIAGLDVTRFSREILEPLLGITDQRRDPRIDFVGGIRGLGELARRVDSGEMAAAFALYPVSMDQLIAISDRGQIMPPKTTWFEPKLRSGLLVHAFGQP